MTDRKPLIAGNWKMYKTGPEAAATAAALVELLPADINVDVMIAPPFTALSAVAEAVAGSVVALGAQNLHWEIEGAFTGEISPLMLTAAGCTHVIIGHSERRQFFGETDTTVNRRIRAACAHRLVPVFCIGETEQERDAGQTFSVLDKQIKNGLEDLFATGLERLVIAYEPVWAIGTGKTATKDQAQEAHHFIRRTVADLFGPELAATVRILYGGSVKPDNAADLMAMADIDGALVGGASLEADSFSRIVQFNQS